MANPFEKRATEYFEDTEAFLAVVTPEPLVTFFKRPHTDGTLYDRLVTVTGTPGSGKTTLARLFEYSTVSAVLRNQKASTYRPLMDALAQCGAIQGQEAAVLGARVPLESEYRDFWEFPYPEDVRSALARALVQARAVIRWLRLLRESGIDLDMVRIVPRQDAEAAIAEIGGTHAHDVLKRAREVERGIYKISRALVPPPIELVDAAAGSAYQPFDVIDFIEVTTPGGSVMLKPLVIFDDAHALHPRQYDSLRRWLARRELRVARWILTRLDALTANQVLVDSIEMRPGLQVSRDITEIRMQNSGDRRSQRRDFRKMAKDMAGRYLGKIETFHRRGLRDLEDLLLQTPNPLPAGKLNQLESHVDSVQRRVGAPSFRRSEFEADIVRYFATRTDGSPELELAMLSILLERYGKRTPQLELGLFADDSEPSKPVTITAGVLEGARIHLLQNYGRAYYMGIDSLCDASSENAEQFLHLAGRLVSQSEMQLVRGKSAAVAADEQNRLLRKRAAEMIASWDFPHHASVRRIADEIATQCVARSVEGNAPLGGGANAWGIPQADFDAIPETDAALARVLQFGVAYNAFVLVPNYGTKGKKWCLIELGGTLLVNSGLTLQRGGFIERSVTDLAQVLSVTVDD